MTQTPDVDRQRQMPPATPAHVTLTPDGALIGPTSAPALHVMTFNIRRRMLHVGSGSPDRWDRRAPYLRSLLRAEMPSLLGVQEALPGQAGFVTASFGSSYRAVGYGRSANRGGEGCPLYFDADRLELMEWGQDALSNNPRVPGSLSWGNIVPRILVRATFRDRATGIRFLAINTHFDQHSRWARIRSARTIRSLVAESALPAIVTGDLNTGEATAPVRELLAEGTLLDAWAVATKRLTPEWGSFTNYREPRVGHKRIDWIAVTPSLHVDSIGINARTYGGGWPSDHAPVQAVVRFDASRAEA